MLRDSVFRKKQIDSLANPIYFSLRQQPTKNRSLIYMQSEGINWNPIKYSIKTREYRERGKGNKCNEYNTWTNLEDINTPKCIIILSVNGQIH